MIDLAQTYLGCHHAAFLFHYPAISNKHETVYISLTIMRLITTENDKINSNWISKKDQIVLLTGLKLTHKKTMNINIVPQKKDGAETMRTLHVTL